MCTHKKQHSEEVVPSHDLGGAGTGPDRNGPERGEPRNRPFRQREPGMSDEHAYIYSCSTTIIYIPFFPGKLRGVDVFVPQLGPFVGRS